MKAQNYVVKVNEQNHGIVIAQAGTESIECGDIGDISNLDATQVEERAKVQLRLANVEIAPLEQVFFEDQKIDLSLVRTKMREVLKSLSDTSVPLSQRKDWLDVSAQMCSTAQIIVNVCKLELQIEQSAKRKK